MKIFFAIVCCLSMLSSLSTVFASEIEESVQETENLSNFEIQNQEQLENKETSVESFSIDESFKSPEVLDGIGAISIKTALRIDNDVFDIYENEDSNNEILQLASNHLAKSDLNLNMEELIYSLPSGQPSLVKLQEISEKSVRGNFDYLEAVAYAETYAWEPNSDYYYFEDRGDCANFVSQILFAGGKVMDQKWNFVAPHKYGCTDAWKVANRLCENFVIDFKTTSFATFMNRVVVGDVIALDASTDGDWDHCGFIVDTGYDMPIGYKDVKIAQHSDNYSHWISSNKTGWPNAGSGASYGIIYRKWL